MDEKIVAVKRHVVSVPIAYKTNLGRIYNYELALEMVEKGMIKNATIEIDKDGVKHIRHKK